MSLEDNDDDLEVIAYLASLAECGRAVLCCLGCGLIVAGVLWLVL